MFLFSIIQSYFTVSARQNPALAGFWCFFIKYRLNPRCIATPKIKGPPVGKRLCLHILFYFYAPLSFSNRNSQRMWGFSLIYRADSDADMDDEMMSMVNISRRIKTADKRMCLLSAAVLFHAYGLPLFPISPVNTLNRPPA